MESNSLKNQIFSLIKRNQPIASREIQKKLGFSQPYINGFLKQLINEKKIVRQGSTNRARYIISGTPILISDWKRNLLNKGLQEDLIFKQVQQDFLNPLKLPSETIRILEYSFSEMLNNAIEHSQSTRILVTFGKDKRNIFFSVRDNGVGIFNNVMEKHHLKSELEAIQDIFKGKQTTMPATHSGQGIFFTSKTADQFAIISGSTQVLVDTVIPDMFIRPHRLHRGTEIRFLISLTTEKKLSAIFHEFSNEEYEFDRTKILVHLFTMDTSFVSRSQARRLLVGLEGFKRITLDFDKVSDIGQGFADEIFRVFRSRHPEIQIMYVNVNPTVDFMIKRVQAVS